MSDLMDSFVEEMRRVGTERLQAEPWADPSHYLNVVARISREDGARMVRCADRIAEDAARIAALEAEVARLREALGGAWASA